MIRRFVDKIAKVLAIVEAEKAQGQPGRAPGFAPAPGVTEKPADEFDRRIRALAEARPNPSARLSTGAVQLFGMDEVRKALGDRRADQSRIAERRSGG